MRDLRLPLLTIVALAVCAHSAHGQAHARRRVGVFTVYPTGTAGADPQAITSADGLTLAWQCSGDTLEAWVSQNLGVSGNVGYRFTGERESTTEQWDKGRSLGTLFVPNVNAFTARATRARTLLFALQHGGNSKTGFPIEKFRIPLTGLAAALKLLPCFRPS